jgi:Asp-tRNA(Asn)/Glu-tRNA(Gln) amidotransferase A subunit family amidase
MVDNQLTEQTLIEAEKLAAVNFDQTQREQMLIGLEDQIHRIRQLRDVVLDNSLPPAPIFDPRLPGTPFDHEQRPVVLSVVTPGEIPPSDEDIAFAPLVSLSAWLREGLLSSTRLTEIYLERLARLGPELECVMTMTPDLARAQAKRADEELRGGNYRGLLHGVPWAAKDLLDTAGIATTWGATPYRDRVPDQDSAVVKKLTDSGAVLVAKTTLGALAYGDIWFGGRTRNPWNTREGSAGSSAGSAVAVAAGLAGFAIGTETLGSIVSPCMRCGTTGLRPTYGRVSRAGAMALCWSLDKIGPICRRVEDTALVLAALNGYDSADPGSIAMPFNVDMTAGVGRLRVGYDPSSFQQEGSDPLDTAVLGELRGMGVEMVEVALPDLPYNGLWTILHAEAAAAFEELTLSKRDQLLVRQDAEAWPNLFRKARLLSAVDLVQAQRFRRLVMQETARVFTGVDAIVGPSFAGNMQLVTNFTGHPSLTIRTGFVEMDTRSGVNPIGAMGRSRDGDEGDRHRVPHGITLWGKLFDEAPMLRLGMALEQAMGAWDARPAMATSAPAPGSSPG